MHIILPCSNDLVAHMHAHENRANRWIKSNLLWPLPIQQYGVLCVKKREFKTRHQQQYKWNAFILVAAVAADDDDGCLPHSNPFTSFQINLNFILKTVVCYHSNWILIGGEEHKQNTHLTVDHTLFKRLLSLKLWMESWKISLCATDLNQFGINFISKNTC